MRAASIGSQRIARHHRASSLLIVQACARQLVTARPQRTCLPAQSLAAIPPSALLLVRPGVPVPVLVAVNGIPAAMSCTAATINVSTVPPSTPLDPSEPTNFTNPAGGQGMVRGVRGGCVML
jgi:hypothetical protein